MDKTGKAETQGQRESVRAFIAIELPSAAQALLQTVQQELREGMGRAGGAIKWVRPESIHLTLQFLGDVPVRDLQAITGAIQRACEGVPPFELSVEGLGCFPNARRPRVIWAGLTGDEHEMNTLRALQAAVTYQTGLSGFKADQPYSPHLTIGRVRDTASRSDITAISEVLSFSQEQPLFETTFRAGSVSLMQSDLGPGGAIYTQLAHVALAG